MATEADIKAIARLHSKVSADDREKLRLVGVEPIRMPGDFTPNATLIGYIRNGLVKMDFAHGNESGWDLSLTPDGRQAAGIHLH